VSFREKLVIWTLLDTGMRVGELCRIARGDVQWQEDRVLVWRKSGR